MPPHGAAAVDAAALDAATSAGSSGAGGTIWLPQQPITASPPACSMSLQLRLMRRLEQTVTLFALLLQLALYSRSALQLTARQHLHQLALLVLRGACFASTVWPRSPTVWKRWRVLRIAALRLAIACVPSQRSAKVWTPGCCVTLWRGVLDGLLHAVPGLPHSSLAVLQSKYRRVMPCCWSASPLQASGAQFLTGSASSQARQWRHVPHAPGGVGLEIYAQSVASGCQPAVAVVVVGVLFVGLCPARACAFT